MPVTGINIVERPQGTLTVSWVQPSQRNGSTSYNISYTGVHLPPYPESRFADMAVGTVINVENTNVSYTITNVLSFATYTFSVFAYNRQLGQNIASASVSDTLRSMPSGEGMCLIICMYMNT